MSRETGNVLSLPYSTFDVNGVAGDTTYNEGKRLKVRTLHNGYCAEGSNGEVGCIESFTGIARGILR